MPRGRPLTDSALIPLLERVVDRKHDPVTWLPLVSRGGLTGLKGRSSRDEQSYMSSPAARPAAGSRSHRRGVVLSGLGQTLLTVGLVLLLFCAYELWGTALVAARAQRQLASDLDRSWTGSPPGAGTPAVGVEPVASGAYARLYLPTVRGHAALVVVEGVDVADLEKGPGHLPGSAVPGEPGNLVLSGHRTTYGAPFGDLDRLRPGDPVVLQTRSRWAVYRMTGSQVVTPDSTSVLLPVPGRPGATPTESLLTMTTCHPRYSARERLVVRGVLTSSTPVAAGRPVVLGD